MIPRGFVSRAQRWNSVLPKPAAGTHRLAPSTLHLSVMEHPSHPDFSQLTFLSSVAGSAPSCQWQLWRFILNAAEAVGLGERSATFPGLPCLSQPQRQAHAHLKTLAGSWEMLPLLWSPSDSQLGAGFCIRKEWLCENRELGNHRWLEQQEQLPAATCVSLQWPPGRLFLLGYSWQWRWNMKSTLIS